MKAAWSQRWLSFDFSSDLALSTWVKGRFEYKQKTKYFPQKVQLNISLRLVAVFPFCCCFAGSLQFSSSRVKYKQLFRSIFRDVFHFCARKQGSYKLQSAPAKGCIMTRNSHSHVAFDWAYHFSRTRKEIVSDSDLTRTHLRMKIYDIAFHWVYLSMHIIKKNNSHLLKVNNCRKRDNTLKLWNLLSTPTVR